MTKETMTVVVVVIAVYKMWTRLAVRLTFLQRTLSPFSSGQSCRAGIILWPMMRFAMSLRVIFMMMNIVIMVMITMVANVVVVIMFEI